MPEISLEAAQELHMKVLKIDGHNDTPVERVARGERPMDLKPRDEAYHCDIPRMKEGGYTCGFMIVGNGAVADVRVTTEQILAQIETYPDDLLMVDTSADVEKAHVLRVLESVDGNKKKAAEVLGIDRSTLYARLKQYGL